MLYCVLLFLYTSFHPVQDLERDEWMEWMKRLIGLGEGWMGILILGIVVMDTGFTCSSCIVVFITLPEHDWSTGNISVSPFDVFCSFCYTTICCFQLRFSSSCAIGIENQFYHPSITIVRTIGSDAFSTNRLFQKIWLGISQLGYFVIDLMNEGLLIGVNYT